MCISQPKVGASAVPTPTQVSAQGLQLGSAALINRSGGIFGRLALSGGRLAQRQAASTAGTPSGDTSTSSPQGTMGLPSSWLGAGVFGGLKSLKTA